MSKTTIVELENNQPKLTYGLLLSEYKDLKGDMDLLDKSIKNLANNFISIGFYLNKIKENKFFSELGFKDIYEFAEVKYKFSKTSTKNFIAVANKFGAKDYSYPSLQGKYKEYNFSQLVELLPEDESNMDKFSPEQTIKEMRITKFYKNIENDENKIYSWLKKDLIEFLEKEFPECKLKYKDIEIFYTFLEISYKKYYLNFSFSKYDFLLNIFSNDLNKSFDKKQILSLKLIKQTVNQFIKKVDKEITEEEKNKATVITKETVITTEVINGPMSDQDIDEYNPEEDEDINKEVVEPEVIDVHVQHLKNNDQRWDYIRNKDSYELIEQMSNDYIRVSKLKDTPYVKIELKVHPYGYERTNDTSFDYREIGFYKLAKDGNFHSLQSFPERDIVEYLKDHKI